MANREFYRFDIVVGTRGDDVARQRLRALDNFIEHTRRRSEMLSRLRISPTARLNDQVSGPLRRIEGTVRAAASRVYTITVQLRDQVSPAMQRIRSALTSVPVMVGLGAAAVAPGVMIGQATKKAMDFEAQLSSIKALTGATREEMAQLSALAIKMGADTKYSALEAAQGIEELLKAGMSLQQIKGGGLEAALSLATAGDLALPDAAEIMSTAMNAFRRDGLAASRAADILAGTANASATSVQELRYALQAVSAVAANVGMSFEDTATALGLFANNGLKGSDAGTSLKTMLMNLIPQTKKQIELFRELGLITKDGSNIFFDAQGRLKSLAEIADILRHTLAGMTEEQRLSVLQEIFGSDAIRAANIIFKEGAEGVRKFKAEMNKVTALDVAKEKMNNAAGAVEQFRGALETMQIAALMPTMPLIKEFALWMADLAEKYTPAVTKRFESFSRTLRQLFSPNQGMDARQRVLTAKEEQVFGPQNPFAGMDTADKIVWLMDRAVEKLEGWMEGPGGEKVRKVFVKLAEIGFRAWFEALTGLLKGSFNQLLQGNFFAAGGLFGLALMLGAIPAARLALRGARLAGRGARGAVNLGRRIMGRVPEPPRSLRANELPYYGPGAKVEQQRRSLIQRVRQRLTRRAPTPVVPPKVEEKVVPRAAERVKPASRLRNVGTKVLRGASRAAFPVAIAVETVNVARANDKVRAAGGAVGGIGGAVMGAKIGGAIGTAVLPGIGTAVGGVLGSIAGGIIGHVAGGKIVDFFRNLFRPKQESAKAPVQGPAPDVAAQMQKIQAELGQAAAKVRAATDQLTVVLRNAVQFATMFGTALLFSSQRIMITSGMVIRNMIMAVVGAGMMNVAMLFSAQRIMQVSALAVRNIGIAALGAGMMGVALIISAHRVLGATTQATSRMGLIAAGSAALGMALIVGASRISQAVDRAVAALSRVSAPAAAPSPVTRRPGPRPSPYANGGIIRRPHLGLVGEAGPEAIIPLSPQRRRRALTLWERVGEYLGVRAYADGGIVGAVPVNAPAPAAAPVGGPIVVQAHIGAVHLGQDVNEEELAMRIGYQLLRAIKQAIENRT